MATAEWMGKTFEIDEDGFINDYSNWSQEWVQWVKNQEGIAGGTIMGDGSVSLILDIPAIVDSVKRR